MSKRKVQPPERLDSREFLMDPDRWPCWPLCPVKRRNREQPSGFPECGLVIAGSTTVYIQLLPMLRHPWRESLQKQLVDNPAVPRTEYESLDALLAAGWEVD